MFHFWPMKFHEIFRGGRNELGTRSCIVVMLSDVDMDGSTMHA